MVGFWAGIARGAYHGPRGRFGAPRVCQVPVGLAQVARARCPRKGLFAKLTYDLLLPRIHHLMIRPVSTAVILPE